MNAIFVGTNTMRALGVSLHIREKKYFRRKLTKGKRREKTSFGINRGEKINSTFHSSSESLYVLLKKLLRDREKKVHATMRRKKDIVFNINTSETRFKDILK